MTWWEDPTQGDETSFVVVEAQLHDLPRWKQRVLEHSSLMVSEATQQLLASIQQSLVVRFDDSDSEKVASADLSFTVNAERAERIQKLLLQEKRDKDGNLLPFTNAYRFTNCEEMGEDTFHVVSRLALGEWQEKQTRGGGIRRSHRLSIIAATTGFQQLLETYYRHPALTALPCELRHGVCQEVAQQVTSYIGQLESSRVKGETAFPTVEIRDPVVRRVMFEQAVDALVSDIRPFSRIPLREKFPTKFAEDDPRGDRLIVDDERWFAVLRSPDPHPIPLFFVNSKAITILRGDAHFSAGISKKDRHRGNMQRDEKVLSSRPHKVREKGVTSLQSWYAALPLLNPDDPVIQGILEERDAAQANGGSGRGLNQNLTLMPLMHKRNWKRNEDEMLVLLSGNRDRLERILMREDLEIAWTRLVQKKGEWYLQLTLRIKTPLFNVSQNQRVLGVSFGIDAIASWSLVGHDGIQIASGALAPNEQIMAFLQEKGGLEWDQAKQRWIGKISFSRKLESIAHRIANILIDLSMEHDAILATEDISYAPKQGRDHVRNVLFTAWNYGQMRKFMEYKSPMAGRGKPLFVSDYIVQFTCPHCGACRKKGETAQNATTWRENGTLHCRKCSTSGELTPEMKALRVAKEGLSFL